MCRDVKKLDKNKKVNKEEGQLKKKKKSKSEDQV